MSHKENENNRLEKRHKEAILAKKNRDPSAKRRRQRFKAQVGTPEEKYRDDTARGRRSLARAQKSKEVVAT